MTDTHQLLRRHAPRTWQRMLSGRRLNLLDPSPMDVEIEDIALGLARNTRWNGQTVGEHAWSIAQHTDLVVRIMRTFRPKPPPWLLMAGQLHDASEYVTHDLITPLKAVVGDVFREVEAGLTAAIHIRFGLPPLLDPEHKKIIKKADLIAAATEAVQLAGFTVEELKPVLGIKARPLSTVTLVPLPSREAERLFLTGFHRLEQEMALAGHPPRR